MSCTSSLAARRSLAAQRRIWQQADDRDTAQIVASVNSAHCHEAGRRSGRATAHFIGDAGGDHNCARE